METWEETLWDGKLGGDDWDYLQDNWVNMTEYDIDIEEFTFVSSGLLVYLSTNKWERKIIAKLPVYISSKDKLEGDFDAFFNAKNVIVPSMIALWCAKNNIRENVYSPILSRYNDTCLYLDISWGDDNVRLLKHC